MNVGGLHGALLDHWLGAIAAELRAAEAARRQEALDRREVEALARRLRRERDWVLDFRWPPGYDPI